MATTDWNRHTVVELRQKLKQRGLSTAGKKADLVERLTAFESEQDSIASPSNAHGTETLLPAESSETTYNDENRRSSTPNGKNGIAEKADHPDNTEPVTEPESAEKAEPIADVEPAVKAELVATSETLESPDSAENSDSVKQPGPVEDIQPSMKSEPVGDSEPTAESEPTQDTESIAKLEPVTDSEPTVDPEPALNAEHSAKSEPVGDSEAAVEPETTVEPEASVEPEPAIEPEPVGDSEPAVEPEPVGDSEPAVEPEPVGDSEPAVEPETTVEPEATVEPEPAVELAPVGDSKAAVVPEATVEPEPAQNAEHITKPEPVGDLEPAVEPEPVVKPEPVVESEQVENLEVSEIGEPIGNSPIAKSPAPAAQKPGRHDEDNNATLGPSHEPEPMDFAPAQPETSTSITDDKKDDPGSEMTTEEAPIDLSKDARGRKRRSRTPPPSDDESSRKRARPGQDDVAAIQNIDDSALGGEEVLPLDDGPTGNDSSYAKMLPDMSTEPQGDKDRTDDSTSEMKNEDGQSQDGLEKFEEDYGNVQPSVHRATSALFIKNFMRPLKENDVRNYLVELATPPGRTPDDHIIHLFFLDQLRSHVFVQFGSIAAAQRTRAQIHTKVWPMESTRKALWADFVPPERIPEWIKTEVTPRQRGDPPRKWEVIYEDNDGEVNLELIDTNDPKNQHKLRGKQALCIPTGPARQFSGIEGAPSGPRGRGALPFQGGRARQGTPTVSGPSIFYTPASNHLVRSRLHNVRSLQNADRYRSVDQRDGANKYTFRVRDILFHCGDARPSSRGRQRYQRPPRNRRYPPGDRYDPGRDRYPASRFDDAGFSAFRGGGGRRPHYWNHR